MSGISFNVSVNTNTGLVDVSSEKPLAEASGPSAKATLTLAQTESLQSHLQQAIQDKISLMPPENLQKMDQTGLQELALECLGQLDGAAFGVASEVLKDVGLVATLAATTKAYASTPGADSNTTEKMAAQVQTLAGNLADALRDIVSNSKYPNFNDALKEIMAAAQELTAQSSQLKQTAIEAKYTVQMDAVDKLKTKNDELEKQARKNLEAETIKASVSLVCCLVACSVMSKGSEAALALGGALSKGGEALGGLAAHKASSDAITAQVNAGNADEEKGQLEASANRMDANTQVAADLEAAGRKLRDAALNLLQQLIAAANTSVSHANV